MTIKKVYIFSTILIIILFSIFSYKKNLKETMSSEVSNLSIELGLFKTIFGNLNHAEMTDKEIKNVIEQSFINSRNNIKIYFENRIRNVTHKFIINTINLAQNNSDNQLLDTLAANIIEDIVGNFKNDYPLRSNFLLINAMFRFSNIMSKFENINKYDTYIINKIKEIPNNATPEAKEYYIMTILNISGIIDNTAIIKIIIKLIPENINNFISICNKQISSISIGINMIPLINTICNCMADTLITQSPLLDTITKVSFIPKPIRIKDLYNIIFSNTEITNLINNQLLVKKIQDFIIMINKNINNILNYIVSDTIINSIIPIANYIQSSLFAGNAQTLIPITTTNQLVGSNIIDRAIIVSIDNIEQVTIIYEKIINNIIYQTLTNQNLIESLIVINAIYQSIKDAGGYEQFIIQTLNIIKTLKNSDSIEKKDEELGKVFKVFNLTHDSIDNDNIINIMKTTIKTNIQNYSIDKSFINQIKASFINTTTETSIGQSSNVILLKNSLTAKILTDKLFNDISIGLKQL